MSVTGVPRKLICVLGLAVTVPGAGETSTPEPASSALWSSVAGRQEGEGPLGGTGRAPDLPVPSTIATVTHATAATSRTMYPFRLMCGCVPRRDTLRAGDRAVCRPAPCTPVAGGGRWSRADNIGAGPRIRRHAYHAGGVRSPTGAGSRAIA